MAEEANNPEKTGTENPVSETFSKIEEVADQQLLIGNKEPEPETESELSDDEKMALAKQKLEQQETELNQQQDEPNTTGTINPTDTKSEGESGQTPSGDNPDGDGSSSEKQIQKPAETPIENPSSESPSASIESKTDSPAGTEDAIAEVKSKPLFNLATTDIATMSEDEKLTEIVEIIEANHNYNYLQCGRFLRKGINKEILVQFYKEFIHEGYNSKSDFRLGALLDSMFANEAFGKKGEPAAE